MNKKGILFLLLCFAISLNAFAGRKGLRINEVMVENDSNYVDDYGMRHGWIELFNSTYNTLKIETMYLTNDKNNPKKYPIPRGDINTNVEARQHVVFFADNDPNKGTFHINFTLEKGKDNWIGLYDTDGKTLIDEVVIPASLPGNASFALKEDGVSSNNGRFNPVFWEVRDGSSTKYITPKGNNIIIDKRVKVEKFKVSDKYGIVLTVIAMMIVFCALILLYLCFKGFGKINENAAKRNKVKAHGAEPECVPISSVEDDSGEAIAAICTALYQHLNAHDNEENVLTINKVRRAYSPWSSKIYTLRETPKR